MKYIIGIDPGTVESGICVCVEYDLRPIYHRKQKNTEILDFLENISSYIPGIEKRSVSSVFVEMVASYGMPVGKDVFETCVWIGRFVQVLESNRYSYEYVYRKEEKMNFCGSPRANDTTIRLAIVDRFAPNTANHGKGTKKMRGFFYAFRQDEWSAFAVAVTGKDRQGKKR